MLRAWTRGFVLAAALCGGWGLGGTARAAGGDDTEIRQQIEMALSSIQFARCGPEKRCEPATPEEMASPPLTPEEASSAFQRGVVSGFARSCGMPWVEKSFRPMIDYWRERKMSDRQIALIGILHGMALGQTEAAIGGKPCTDKLRRDIEAQLSTFP